MAYDGQKIILASLLKSKIIGTDEMVWAVCLMIQRFQQAREGMFIARG